ncbi:MAG: hypothetical protein J6A15_07415 [Clostridia bacterium]|nr:hypothetical protein [Clostridia bacterium]
MKKISEFIKSLGFTFSFKRARKAFVLVFLFALIGVGVYLFYEFENSESGLKRIYAKEVSQKMDLQGKEIIKIYKKDVNEDKKLDYVFIAGEELRSGENELNSVVEMYNNVDFVIIDGQTELVTTYETGKNFNSNVTLQVCEDEQDRYFIISDLSGNISLCKLVETEMQDVESSSSIVDIVKNTTSNEFLGYTIYTKKDAENSNIVNVTIDNFSKEYLGESKDTKKLDFTEMGIDISKYRETYLRDKFSEFELKDTNNDGILELVAYQHILYSLDDEVNENKTLGIVETIFNIEEDKLKFNKVEVKIQD